MSEEQKYIKLVRLAREGRKDCMNELARQAEGRLRAYIYRVTLDYDLTQDLSQEALMEMVKSLSSLKKIELFWPWLYRIAQSKIQQHYRVKQKKAAISASVFYDDFLSQHADHQDDGLRDLLKKELSKIVMTAMTDVKQQYRAVLSLRCFEQLPYSDVALTMDCSEVKARILFYRAKQALKKQLMNRGLSKGLLLMCLGLFGKLTTPAEAASSAVTVTAASAKVGLPTAVVAAAGTKLGVATIAATIVTVATVGGVSVLSEPSGPALPRRTQVTSLHYTTQARNTNPGAVASLSKGAYEQWYYFPDGIDGPMFMRMQRWDPQQTRELCAWLQNDEGNYYFHAGQRQVYANNYRLWLSSLRVRRLPSDTAEFTSFLLQVEGHIQGVRYKRDRKTGLLAGAVDNRFVDTRYFRTNYQYNTLSRDEFQYDWPGYVSLIDDRDQMHMRGWTYFRINGQMRGKTVTGQGRLPFVYDTWKDYPPWMTLNIGDDLQLIDSASGAYVCGADGGVIAAYPSGTFFKGLLRPWMGIHTVDIVRRDAAEQRMWFETIRAENEKDVFVILFDRYDKTGPDVIYTIDLENDIIKEIKFDVRNATIGWLKFSYLQDIDEAGGEFAEPQLPADARLPAEQASPILWLISWPKGNLID